VPGEVSKICGVYISGWRANTEDRVYIDVPTRDAWGSLQVNRNIVIVSGHWSLAPEHMQREEHGVSLYWSARSTAFPGSFQAPITIRQRGAGQVVLTQNIRIVSGPGASSPPTAAARRSFPSGGRRKD